jgi:hypothetical protein
MNKTSENKRGWRLARRILVGLAVLATLLGVFYTEEDWRGQRAWENYKHELNAQGVVLDWNAYIPPPVPADQNFFKATNMTAWFVKGTNMTFSDRLKNSNTVAVITTEAAARDYLAWSDSFEPEFDQIREALKRPYAWIDCDYNQPSFLVPSFLSIRSLVQTLAQRAKCDLLLGRPAAALRELTLLNDSRRMLMGAPTGKPMTLLAAMINVAVTGPYVSAIADGLHRHAWLELQLIALQQQLADIDLLPVISESLHEHPVWAGHLFETLPLQRFFELDSPWYVKFFPRGWDCRNMIHFVRLCEEPLGGFDLANDTISPALFDQASRHAHQQLAHPFPFNIFLIAFMPNITRAVQTTAYNQTLVNEAQIACALERCRLAQGEYPETLDALVPHFIAKLPHDLIGGQSLLYRRQVDGKFLLYSIGWNQTDDHGQPSSLSPAGVVDDYNQEDWIWK